MLQSKVSAKCGKINPLVYIEMAMLVQEPFYSLAMLLYPSLHKPEFLNDWFRNVSHNNNVHNGISGAIWKL
jgi:hypothetical protein